ncbi:hypothetical protein [Methanoculleus methanifontis]|uniref:hypothetical protein n=1 Tax=Methanoculleus methanifontis TaxID=2584086 RepID=UPI002659EF0D|nr:hypothetical protein [Methanoculleus sp. FWC-SCC3]
MNPSGSPKRPPRTIKVEHSTFVRLWMLKHRLGMPSYDAVIRHLLKQAGAEEE